MCDADKDTLEVQLEILNERSRWYSSELWQIPFAYLGITGVLIAAIISQESAWNYLALAFAISALIGVAVLVHMINVRKLEQKAVLKLKNVEKQLGLKDNEGAEISGGWHTFQYLVAGTVVLYFILTVFSKLASQ